MIASNPKNLTAALLAATMLAGSIPFLAGNPAAAAEVSISVTLEPPALPVYEQPAIPAPGYLWTPGYWAYDESAGYYWVPGTWVEPPETGVLWTPPYWAFENGAYLFHAGYWGPEVGFYGGVDYGFGYGGLGFEGGRWENGSFSYNRTVNNFGDVQIKNVYESKVTVVNESHVSYVGGPNGIKAEPTAEQRKAEQEHHVEATAAQAQQAREAAKNPEFSAKQNGGHPQIAATSKPGQFTGPGVVHASGAPAQRPGETGREAQPGARPEEHAPAERPTPQQAARPPGAESPASRPAERPVERPAERPGEEHPAERPAQPSAEHPAERPAQPSAEHPAERPAQPSAERPAERPAQPPAERPAERPAQPPAERPAQPPAERPAAPAAAHPAAPAGAPQHPAEQKPGEKPGEQKDDHKPPQ
jgi:hypothetical protein